MTSQGIRLRLVEGDLTALDVEAVVNPANSYGQMGGGVAGALRKKGGPQIEAEAVKQAPIPIGKAVLTTGGALPCRYVIHAPTMVRPAEGCNVSRVKKATVAALECADEKKLKKIAFPGMGTGVGGLDPVHAAKAMVEVTRSFQPRHLEEVTFVAFGEDLKNAFEEALQTSARHA